MIHWPSGDMLGHVIALLVPTATIVCSPENIGLFVSSNWITLRSPGGGFCQLYPAAQPEGSPESTNATRDPSGDHAGAAKGVPVTPLVVTGFPSAVVKRPMTVFGPLKTVTPLCAIEFGRMYLLVGDSAGVF